MSRYSGLEIQNSERGPCFGVPKIPNTDFVFENVDVINYTWKSTDRMDKVAFLHYGDERLWWILCWFNKLPDESFLSPGDPIWIPRNPEIVVSLFQQTNQSKVF